MFNKVLLATDFSQRAEQLWNCIEELQGIGTKELVLVHIAPLTTGGRHQGYALEKLNERKNHLESLGLSAKVAVRVGLAAKEISNIAVKEKVDLVLVGAKGENLIRKMIMGSTVWDLIRMGKSPILVEKFKDNGHENTIACPLKFNRVLLPTDFSDAAMHVYSLVKEKMALHLGELLLIHVVDKGHTEDLVEKQKYQASNRLAQMKKELEEAGVSKVSTTIRMGVPSQHIVRLAEDADVSLVMMATRGAGSIKELLVGSTTENVARESARPVLMFPVRD
jgi:nucleotide-binding universal stress UspA family protein